MELYQAANAVQIAESVGADRYAPDTFNKAVGLLNDAQGLEARKGDTRAIVADAREAAQMAEDSRVLAIKRRDEKPAAPQAQ